MVLRRILNVSYIITFALMGVFSRTFTTPHSYSANCSLLIQCNMSGEQSCSHTTLVSTHPQLTVQNYGHHNLARQLLHVLGGSRRSQKFWKLRTPLQFRTEYIHVAQLQLEHRKFESLTSIPRQDYTKTERGSKII